jgi:predicted XRE-type DNA-binding protein
MSKEHVEVYEGSGNIFADLGLPDAETHYLKAQIVAELFRLTNGRKLTQAKAGALMGISQPEVSRLFKGNFREYSIDRLMTFLTTFDRDIEIVSRPRPSKCAGERGRITFKPVAA